MSAIAITASKYLRKNFPEEKSNNIRAATLLIVGLAMIIHSGYEVLEKNGHWDAWWFWNVRANYLTRPDSWRLAFSGNQYGTLFTVPVAHSDYPPFLPLLNGFTWRLLQTQASVIPFFWSICALLLTCSILFVELYHKNKIIGVAALFFMTTQQYFIRVGTNQTADLWIALYLLLAAMSFHAYNISKKKDFILFTGLMLGACMWTKNEGIILTIIFIAVIARKTFREKSVGRFVTGISVPLLALVVFKLAFAPRNDIVLAIAHFPFEKIADLSRYNIVRRLTWDIIELYFPAIPYIFAGYIIFCISSKCFPGKLFLIICLSFIAYLCVYIITPHDLGWHVNTSVDRLICQLLPTFIWLAALPLTAIEFRLKTHKLPDK